MSPVDQLEQDAQRTPLSAKGSMMTTTEKTKAAMLLTKLIDICERIGMLCLAGITIIILLQILLRNLFSIGIAWAEETARFLHISLIFLVVPVLQKDKKLLSVDYVVQRLSPKIASWINKFSLSICIIFSILCIISFYLFMQSCWDVVTPDLGMPNIIFYSSYVFGFISFVLISVEQIINEIMDRSKNNLGVE